MKRDFIHLPFNMLFYLILKDSKNSVLYGLNKEHVSFTAHHETKCGLGVGHAGHGHGRVAGRAGGRQGRRLQGRAGAACSPEPPSVPPRGHAEVSLYGPPLGFA